MRAATGATGPATVEAFLALVQAAANVGEAPEVELVTLAEFAAVDEPGAGALVGSENAIAACREQAT